MRALHRGVALVLGLVLVLAVGGCGEVERIDLQVRPRQDDFTNDVHGLLLQAGCSRGGGCHAILGAGSLIILEATDEVSLLESYESVTALIDRETATESRLLYYVSTGDERAEHFPPDCWKPGDCVYRKIAAWIGWDGADQPRPGEIDCDVAADPLECQ